MPALDRDVAALRIFGDDLDPEELSRLFGHSYTDGWGKGNEFSTSSGAVVPRKLAGGYSKQNRLKTQILMAKFYGYWAVSTLA